MRPIVAVCVCVSVSVSVSVSASASLEERKRGYVWVRPISAMFCVSWDMYGTYVPYEGMCGYGPLLLQHVGWDVYLKC